MWIYVFRHGIAIDREDPSCPPDPERSLTERGVQRTRQAAMGMAAMGVEIDLALSSPYVRARQTAELALEVLDGEGRTELTITDALLPAAPSAALFRELQRRRCQAALCVGHAPHLDEFVAHLVGSAGPITSLKKAGLACIELETDTPGGGWLRAVYPPRALRQLAKLT